MGDKSQIITLEAKDGRIVTFDDNDIGKVIGIGNIRIIHSIFISACR